MAMKSGSDYKESLKQRNINVYAFGEKIKEVTAHPLFQPHVEAA